MKSVRSIVAAPLEGDPLAGIDTVTSPPEPEVEIAQVGSSDVGDGYIWSPWLGTCQVHQRSLSFFTFPFFRSSLPANHVITEK